VVTAQVVTSRIALRPVAVLFGLAILVVACAMFPDDALAQATASNNVIEQITDTYKNAAQAWQSILAAHAKSLFWLLATIELTYSALRLVLDGSDIKDFGVMIVQRLLTIGFFYTLLVYSAQWAPAIKDGLAVAANHASVASGGSPEVYPAQLFDLGLSLTARLTESMSFWSPADSAGLFIAALTIMILFAVLAAEYATTLISLYIVLNAGVLFLGFGGASWTRDAAIQYYKFALQVGVQLFALQLIVVLGIDLIAQWGDQIQQDNGSVFAIIGGLIVFTTLAKKVPSLLSGIVAGVGGGGSYHGGGGYASSIIHTASAATSSVAGGVMAVGAAGKLSTAQPSGNTFGAVGRAMNNLGAAMLDDASGRIGGVPGYQFGTHGGRMTDKLRNKRREQAAAPNSRNTIGPG
jgi:type IV secretion system protein TrbL